jgi:hypothetical protein
MRYSEVKYPGWGRERARAARTAERPMPATTHTAGARTNIRRTITPASTNSRYSVLANERIGLHLHKLNLGITVPEK